MVAHNRRTNAVNRAADQTGADLREAASDLREDVENLATAATSMLTDQLDPVEAYVRKHPIKSLFMAAGAGAVLAIFLRK